jgi:hypothetical protein
VALVAGITLAAMPARADIPDPPAFVIVPPECVAYWPTSTWDRWLSFATCQQDASVGRVERVVDVEPLFDELEAALLPTVQFYFAAVREGPPSIKVRAGFQMAMTQVALMTRLRASICTPAGSPRATMLHDEVERVLEPAARLAWMLFTAIDEAVEEDPTRASDVVAQGMVRSARFYAAVLARRWEQTPEPLIADERNPPWLDSTSLTRTSP